MNNTKEINTIELLAKMLLLIKRNLILIFIIVALVMALGLLKLYYYGDRYHTTFYLSVPNQFMDELSFVLNDLNKNHSVAKTFKKRYNISEEQFELLTPVKEISIDTNINNFSVMITLSSTKKINEKKSEILELIVGSINSDEVIKNELIENQKILNSLYENINEEITQLNSLQTIIQKKLEEDKLDNLQVDEIMASLSSTYNQSLILLEKKYEIEHKIADLKPIELYNQNLECTENISFKMNILLFLLAGIIISFLIVFIIAFIKLIVNKSKLIQK